MYQTKKDLSQWMAVMDELFMTPSLPYKDYITEHGLHHVTSETSGKHYHARYEFPEQQISVSLIHGPMFYCKPDTPYEWRIFMNYEYQEPEGYKTEEELYILLTKILGGSYGLPV